MCFIFFRQKVQRWRQRPPGSPNGLLVRHMRMTFGHAMFTYLTPHRLPVPLKRKISSAGQQKSAVATSLPGADSTSQCEWCDVNFELSPHNSFA